MRKILCLLLALLWLGLPARASADDPAEEKVIYLTFDDGPGPYTEKLLDILDRHSVKATFFVVDTPYVSLLGEIARRGHTIGIHSASHDFARVYAGEDAFFQDLTAMRNIIRDEAGICSDLIRFPGGSSNTVSRFNPGIMKRLTKAVEEMGYVYFDWNVDSNDAGGAQTAWEVYNNVTRGCKGIRQAVVLQHDTKGFSVEAVEWIIGWGKASGYRFAALDENSPTVHHNVQN